MRVRNLLAIFLAASTSLAAARKHSVIYLRTTDAIDLDPWQTEDVYSAEIACNIFEGLVRFKKNSITVEPCLATSWRVMDNGRRWVFTLRRGVQFHDGTPLDAQAVLYTFQNRLEKPHEPLSDLFSFISGVSSRDPFHVEITLKRPYAPFLTAMADVEAFIVPPAARRSGVFRPIGTGPFRFLSWSRGKSLILARNPNYWAGAPRLERIIFKVMPDSQGRLLQIKSGSADMAAIQSSKEYNELSHRSDIVILSHPSTHTHYLGFNTRKKPFDQKEVRAAFLHLINKESMIKQIFQYMAVPAHSSLPPLLLPGQEDQPANSFDLKAARALLTTSGLANGFSCSLYFAENQEGVQAVADLLTLMAKRIKVTIRKVKLPFPELVKAIDHGDHDMLLMGWTTGPDPDLFLYPLFTFSPGNQNYFMYGNPELTRLLDEGKTKLDPRQRARIYQDAIAILKRDLPWIPMFHLTTNIACSRKISGLAFTPAGQAIFREASKESR